MPTLLPSDAFVTAAFDELIADVAALVASTQAQKPLDRDELKFWRAQLGALNKAQYAWATGARPERAGAAWLMPSASRPGSLIHRLAQAGGVWLCSCEAGQHGRLCWHHMLINVLERASELEALESTEDTLSGGDGGDLPMYDLPMYDPAPPQFAPIPPYLPPFVPMGVRLSAARRPLLEAA